MMFEGSPLDKLHRMLSGQGAYNAVVLVLLTGEKQPLATWAEITLKELLSLENDLRDAITIRGYISMIKEIQSPQSEVYIKANAKEKLLENPEESLKRIAELREHLTQILESSSNRT